MKATEVLNRYANGDRDFRRANLRGQSFKGRDLSGADFTEADICGANFTNTILKKASFTDAKAGVQRRWTVCQLLLLLVLSALTGVFQGFFGYYIVVYFPRWWNSTYDWTHFASDLAVTIAFFFTIITASFAITHQGFTTKAAATIGLAVAVAIAVAIAGAGVVAIAGAGAGAVTIAIAIAGAVAGAGAGAVAIAIAVAIAGACAVTGTVAATGAIAVTSAGAVTVALAGAGAVAITVAIAVAVLSLYVAWRVRKGDEKFALVRSLGIAFAAIGGTSFRGADLTGANFTNATLRSTNFNHTRQQQTNLTHVCWQNTRQLDRARVGDSILAHASVRELLVTRNGYNKRYIDANLRGANLQGVNLQQANLTGADLSNATLHHAELKDANLREVLAIGTDFTSAHLTGACLEAWNIDHTTKLDQVDCQYIFLLEQPNQFGSRERRPHDPDQVFGKGDFEKLYKKMMNVVQVLLKNGMTNQAAFNEAFQQLLDEQPTLSRDSLQAVERKGDDALITLEVPEAADKAEISRSLHQSYEDKVLRLEAKVEELHQLRAADLKEVALAQKAQFFNQFTPGGNAMQEANDSSRNINVGGNVTGSTLNLGEISGSVSNVVNALPSAPDPAQPGIKELLIELQAAIESDADLPEKGKASALEQVKVLAEVAQNPGKPEKKGLGSQAVTFFKNAASFLPDTAKLAEACSKLLPLITKVLGLPF